MVEIFNLHPLSLTLTTTSPLILIPVNPKSHIPSRQPHAPNGSRLNQEEYMLGRSHVGRVGTCKRENTGVPRSLESAPPPQDHYRALGMGLLQDSVGGRSYRTTTLIRNRTPP